MTRNSVAVLTDLGYMLVLNWDGSIAPAQPYYMGANCTGVAFLNAGSSRSVPLYARTLVFLKSADTLAVPANVAINGSAPSMDNPDCTAGGSNSGWELKATTATAVGLPDGVTNQFATPLTLS